ncbi:hypothetical protein ACI2K4_02275 [Micromonospora sp. NPDC050397]|uniref:hypothetical protein n=1 Tax=Micromonospora sp. NPDC050397 TaxID=3364279 RepID=UPI00384F2ED2
MNPVLRSLVDRGGGLVTTALVREVVSRQVFEWAVKRGELRRILPEVYADARMIGGGGTVRYASG